MSKSSPARYRTTNWSGYNASLRKRGSSPIRVDKDMAWRAPRDGRPGRPSVFSDAAIQVCLSIRILFRSPLRQTAGMVASLLRPAGPDWPVPDFSTLCRRQKTLAGQIPYRRADGPPNLLVDNEALAAIGPRTMPNGIRFLSGGEWQARKHGVQGRRQWRKVHLAMDPATSDIRAVEFTPSRDGDSPVLPDLLGQIPAGEQIGTVTADGAHDTRRCHTAIIAPAATPIIPIRRNGRLWKEDCPAARPQRHPARHTALRAGIPEARDRMPCPQQDRGEDARPESLRRTHRCKRPRPPDRRNPPPHPSQPISNPWRSPAQSCTASTPSAPPRSSAWPDVRGERASHVSGRGSATCITAPCARGIFGVSSDALSGADMYHVSGLMVRRSHAAGPCGGRGSGPDQSRVLEGTLLHPGYPDPVSRLLRHTSPCPFPLRRSPAATAYAAATGAL
jgi:hypothetical protein